MYKIYKAKADEREAGRDLEDYDLLGDEENEAVEDEQGEYEHGEAEQEDGVEEAPTLRDGEDLQEDNDMQIEKLFEATYPSAAAPAIAPTDAPSKPEVSAVVDIEVVDIESAEATPAPAENNKAQKQLGLNPIPTGPRRAEILRLMLEKVRTPSCMHIHGRPCSACGIVACSLYPKAPACLGS